MDLYDGSETKSDLNSNIVHNLEKRWGIQCKSLAVLMNLNVSYFDILCLQCLLLLYGSPFQQQNFNFITSSNPRLTHGNRAVRPLTLRSWHQASGFLEVRLQPPFHSIRQSRLISFKSLYSSKLRQNENCVLST